MMAEIFTSVPSALSVKEMEDQDEPLPNMVFVVPAHKMPVLRMVSGLPCQPFRNRITEAID